MVKDALRLRQSGSGLKAARRSVWPVVREGGPAGAVWAQRIR